MEIFAHEMARKDAQIGLLKKVVESSEKLVDALFEKGRYLAIDASVCTLHVDYIQAKAAAGICPKL